jgi:DeoR family transcriptional regulator, catabolite repression regulator
MSIQNKKFNVGECMIGTDSFPVIDESVILKEVLDKMDSMGLGIACIVGVDRRLLGVITDGDIRRKLLSVQRPLPALFLDNAIDQAIKSPITVSSKTNLIDAVILMEEKQILDLPVVDNNRLVGLLHLHKAIKILMH